MPGTGAVNRGRAAGVYVLYVPDASPFGPVRNQVPCTRGSERPWAPPHTAGATASRWMLLYRRTLGPFTCQPPLCFPTVAQGTRLLTTASGQRDCERIAAYGWGSQRLGERCLPSICVSALLGNPRDRGIVCYRGPPQLPEKRRDGDLSPSASEWDLIWGQGLYRDIS